MTVVELELILWNSDGNACTYRHTTYEALREALVVIEAINYNPGRMTQVWLRLRGGC